MYRTNKEIARRNKDLNQFLEYVDSRRDMTEKMERLTYKNYNEVITRPFAETNVARATKTEVIDEIVNKKYIKENDTFSKYEKQFKRDEAISKLQNLSRDYYSITQLKY